LWNKEKVNLEKGVGHEKKKPKENGLAGASAPKNKKGS